MPWARPGYWSIYRLTCLPTGKSYVGMTREHVNRRWSQHRAQAIGGKRNTAIGAAIRKYGPDNFCVEVIDKRLSIDEAVTAERQTIAALNTLVPNGYNLTDGGEHQKNLAHEARRKISQKAQGRVVSEATRAKLSAASAGRKLELSADERARRGVRAAEMVRRNKEKISAAVIASNQRRGSAQARRAAAAEARAERQRKAGEKAEIRSAWLAGKEERETARVGKIAAWHRGQKRSDETKERMSVAAKARIGIPRRKNQAGVAGVWFDKVRQRWRAQITINGRAFALGRFDHKEDAVAARLAAENAPAISVEIKQMRSRLREWGAPI